MKHKIIYLCAVVLFIISCKKDEPLKLETADKQLLSQVIIDNEPYYEYSYNSAKLIEDEKSRFDLMIHHFNDKNQIASTDCFVNYDILSTNLNVSVPAMNLIEWVTSGSTNKSGTISYDYNASDQLIKTTYSPVTGGSQSSEFVYDANGRIGRQNIFWEKTKTGYIDYTYDPDGNLMEEMLYNVTATGSAELSTTTLYEFDNKQNPYKSVSRMMLPGITTNVNNITKETYTINSKAGQGSPKVQITVSSYKYNSLGLPVSKNGNVDFVYV